MASFLAQQLLMRQDRQPGEVPVPLTGICSIGEPVASGEVDSLPNIEAIGEARVVCPGEGDDKLPRILDHAVHLHACSYT